MIRFVAAACLLRLAARESQRPMTRAGAAVDQAGTRTGEALDRAATDTGAALDRAGGWVRERTR